MLTTDDMQRIMREIILNQRPSRCDSHEQAEFRARVRKDIERAIAAGFIPDWTVEPELWRERPPR